jgi:hypothetical protein
VLERFAWDFAKFGIVILVIDANLFCFAFSLWHRSQTGLHLLLLALVWRLALHQESSASTLISRTARLLG